MENKVIKLGIGTLLIAAVGVWIYKRSKQKLQVLEEREKQNTKVLEEAGYKIDEVDGTITSTETGNVAESKDFVRDLFTEVVYDVAHFGEECINTSNANGSENVVHIRQTWVDGIDYIDFLFTIPESAYVDGGPKFKNGSVDIRDFLSTIIGRFDKELGKRVEGFYEQVKDKYFSMWGNLKLQAELDGYLLITFEALTDEGEWEERSAMIKVDKYLDQYKNLLEEYGDRPKNEVLTMFMKNIKLSESILESSCSDIRNIVVQDSLLACRLSYPMFKENEQCGITVEIAKKILLDILDEEDGVEVTSSRSRGSFKYEYLMFYPYNYDNLVCLDREYDEKLGREKTVLNYVLG